MSKKKILVVNDLHKSFLDLMDHDFFDVDYQPEIKEDHVKNIIGNYHGLVVRSKLKITTDLIADASLLEFIARAGAGVDNIDVSAVKGTDIKIFNAPEGNRDAVGEHTIGMLLSLFNHLGSAHQEVINGKWRREANRGIELRGKCVGIIGFGNTGQALAKKLSGFDCEVIAYDKYHQDLISPHARMESMDKLRQKVDVLSIHVPLTAETTLLINDEYFEGFQKNIFVINTSRGKVLSLEALLNQIRKGKVLGAALDVLENEKLASHTDEEKKIMTGLIESNKVLLTPHVAGWTYESYRRISEVLASKIMHHYQQTPKVV